ncbi:xylosidase, partial [Streptomyces sp. SID11233]|nr:xylosidase [Streptomyces sp. SID11233]
GQDYLPVIYPGFSWSNWKDGPRNEIPRRSGDFLWQQAVNVRKAGVGQAFLAMFDEYDEATAIAPAAEDSSMIPTDQYFQTTSADGTYLSADFYLRLAGAATGMISGRDPLDPEIPVPPSTGP